MYRGDSPISTCDPDGTGCREALLNDADGPVMRTAGNDKQSGDGKDQDMGDESMDRGVTMDADALIDQLGSASFTVRLDASKQLSDMGADVLPALDKALTSENLRVRTLARQLINDRLGHFSSGDSADEHFSVAEWRKKIESMDCTQESANDVPGIRHLGETVKRFAALTPEQRQSQIGELTQLGEMVAKGNFGKDLSRDERSHLRQSITTQIEGLREGNKLLDRIPLVDFRNSEVTDQELVGISKLHGLKDLRLSHCASLTNDGLAEISGMTQLTNLALRTMKIDDGAMVHLKGLTNLESLHLGMTKVGDEGLKQLKDLTHLKMLDLVSTEVSGAGLASIAKAKDLEVLDLDHCHNIDDESIANIENFANLKELRIRETCITAEGLEKLKAALPNCKILWEESKGNFESPAPLFQIMPVMGG